MKNKTRTEGSKPKFDWGKLKPDFSKMQKPTWATVKTGMGKAWSGYSFIFIFLAIFIIFMIISGGATTWNGVMNIFRHSSVIGLIAIGMGLVIITGGIDLSVGSMLALVGGISVQVFNQTNSIFATFVVAIVFGTFLGLINGLLIGKAKMPAFIVTLGTMLIYRSIAQYYLRAALGTSIFMMDGTLSSYDKFFQFGNGFVITIPITGILLIAITLVFIFMTNRTKYGRFIYAIGSNEKAAYLAGVNVDWIRVSVYAITGTLVGFGAFLWLGMNGSVDAATIGKSYEMYAIAAAVIGGVSMAGGKGKIIGIFFGALSYTVIDKIIAALGVDALINDTIKGLILLLAVFLQLVGPMLKGMNLAEYFKNLKMFKFGLSKKAVFAEAAAEAAAEGGGTSEDDALTEAETAAQHAVEEVLEADNAAEATPAADEVAEQAEEAVSECENAAAEQIPAEETSAPEEIQPEQSASEKRKSAKRGK